jgi:hypothetical protein
MRYKRNQVEEAIQRVLARPRIEIRTRLKRLLDADRALGRTRVSTHAPRANFAFYSSEAAGRGVEIWFSKYEVFALLLGLLLLRHGWPQKFVVTMLRRVRPELEKHHDRVMKQDRKVLFDQQLIRQRARSGDLAVTNTDPVFLVFISTDRDRPIVRPAAICRGQKKLAEFVRIYGAGQAWTMFELASAMHQLASELAKTKPSKRGRGSR